MIHVQRDAAGQLLRVDTEPFDGMTESLAGTDPEVAAWLTREDVRARLQRLKESDLELVRVIEDLVNVLVDKGVMRYTDLPLAARGKLQAREAERSRLGELSNLLSDEDQLLP